MRSSQIGWRTVVGPGLIAVLALAACGEDAETCDPRCDDTSSDATLPDVPDDSSAPDGSDHPDTDLVDADPTDTSPPPTRVDLFDNVRISSWDSDPNFQRATVSFTFPDQRNEDAVLVVELRSTCYPFENWTRPPAGHNWPADCDAFDRNFEFVLNPATAERPGPGIELVRAITPFGGPMDLRIDVTDVANFYAGQTHDLMVVIPTWSDGAGIVSGSHGGWNVSAWFELREGTAPRDVLAILPLYDGNIGSQTGDINATYEIPDGATGGRVEYRVTGHGGGASDPFVCIGPAEEFCRRPHYLWIDDAVALLTEPWREDCDTLCTLQSSPFEHCLENPCGAIQSVRAPRANWCPGDVTAPYILDAPALVTPGEHTLRVQIEDIAAGGSWRTSAVVFAWR